MEQQREEEDRRRELAQELVQYWTMSQRSEDSRDADINYNHQGEPSVGLVNQEALGPASMQVFQVYICSVCRIYHLPDLPDVLNSSSRTQNNSVP